MTKSSDYDGPRSATSTPISTRFSAADRQLGGRLPAFRHFRVCEMFDATSILSLNDVHNDHLDSNLLQGAVRRAVAVDVPSGYQFRR